MGGFVDGRELLSLEDIERLVRTNQIVYPIVTREEIQDRSKGDAVTKALVVLQTTWFLLQCAARGLGRQHLAVTELELATAAFAVLNLVIYALWWDKPLDVHCPIVVVRRRRRRRSAAQDDARAAAAILERNREGSQPGEESGVAAPRQERDGWARARSLGWLRDGWQSVFFCGWACTWTDVGAWLQSVLEPYLVMMGGSSVHQDMFFVVGGQDDIINGSSGSGMALVTMAFGGIHCIAWSFAFPSQPEQLLWRISSMVITGFPLALVGVGFVGQWLHEVFITLLVLLVVLYPVSRIVLLVLSLSTLRSLPPSAYQTVQWTTFLPHV